MNNMEPDQIDMLASLNYDLRTNSQYTKTALPVLSLDRPDGWISHPRT